MSYKFRGRIVGVRESNRVATPSFEGDSSSMPTSDPPYMIEVVWDRPSPNALLPWGLLPVDLGTRVVVEIGVE